MSSAYDEAVRYEKADKSAPFLIKTLFAGLNVVASLVLNYIAGQPFNPIELLVLVGSVLYAYSFGIRNLKLLRMFFIVPTMLNIIYFALIPNSVFYLVSYSFEFCANVVAMILYRDRRKAFERKKQKNQLKTQKQMQDK